MIYCGDSQLSLGGSDESELLSQIRHCHVKGKQLSLHTGRQEEEGASDLEHQGLFSRSLDVSSIERRGSEVHGAEATDWGNSGPIVRGEEVTVTGHPEP